VETAVVTQEATGLWLQLGAFGNRESADRLPDRA
jgi:hypothetical protein